MFKVIEPQEYCYYRGRVDLFVELLKQRQDVPLSSEEQELSTFIVGQGEEGHIYGGAILQQRHVSELPAHIESVISTVIPNRKHVWAATFSLCAEPAIEDPSLFYADLLKRFIDFGKEKSSSFLCLSLTPAEYMRTEGWPYVLEVSPDETSDGLFHGILSLSGDAHALRASGRTSLIPSSPSKRQLAA